MADDIKLDLDPQKVLAALQELKGEFGELASAIETQLGKRAKQSIGDLEQAANNGTQKITSYFRTLGQRVKEDLKTAFDATGVLAGVKFSKDLGEGVRQIFDMERAFDRLNTRLKLTNGEMNAFKTNIGRKVANTGTSMQDVLPGVENASARGGVKDAGQLANIGEALGKAKAITGEDTAALSETVVEILKNQGQKVTDETFKRTLDAIQGTRVSGAFTSAEDAGSHIQALSPYAKQFGLSTRQLGGLSATASTAGSAGNNILEQLLKQASVPGGGTALNSIFGQQIFKNGKIDAGAIGKIDTGRFGQYSQQTLESATGLQGASGADLKRFIEAFKGNMANFNQVVAGSNETGDQFETATNNLASKMAIFKENVKRAASEVGEQLSQAGAELLKGHIGAAVGDVGNAAGKAWENKGTLATAGLMTGVVGLLAGGGLNSLLGKVGGGAVAGAAAKAAGVEPVYVVNAADMGGVKFDTLSGRLGTMIDGWKAMPGGIVGQAGKFGLMGAGVAAAGGIGYGAGTLINKGIGAATGGGDGWLGDKLYDMMNPDEIKESKVGANDVLAAQPFSTDMLADAVHQGMTRAQGDKPKQFDYINKSAVQGTGRAM